MHFVYSPVLFPPVQGMSYIACMLLLNLDVRAAFQCFANLVNASVHYDFFSLEGARMDRHVAAYDCPFPLPTMLQQYRYIYILYISNDDTMQSLFSYPPARTFLMCCTGLVRRMLPRVHAHFAAEGVGHKMYLVDWLLTLYTKALPLTVAARVWDNYFLVGDAREQKPFPLLLFCLHYLLYHRKIVK